MAMDNGPITFLLFRFSLTIEILNGENLTRTVSITRTR